MSGLDRLSKTSDFKVVGTRPVRPDGVEKVTGKARFGADAVLPGMLTGMVLRSPHPHARILSIDTSRAEALPGVKAVITSADFAEVGGHIKDRLHNVMAHGKALYEGHALAAVAAIDKETAKRASPPRPVHVEFQAAIQCVCVCVCSWDCKTQHLTLSVVCTFFWAQKDL